MIFKHLLKQRSILANSSWSKIHSSFCTSKISACKLYTRMTETKEDTSHVEESNVHHEADAPIPVSKPDHVSSSERGNLSKRAYKRLLRRKARINGEKGIEYTSVPKGVHSSSVGLNNREIADLINTECFNETEYYIENGLRKVYPYYYDFSAHAKGRWFGQKLVDIFVKEFQNNTLESCTQAIEGGSITVNGKLTTTDYVIKNGDVIVNRVHRHELPVVHEPIQVLVDNDEVLVVNKPSSIPVHPCGRYRHNSLLYVLAREMGYKNLRGLYRLDRLTSGLLIFGRNEKTTALMMSQIRERLVEKEYVCRVKGEFPLDEIVCEQPIGTLSEKLGIYRVTSTGKESKTTFQRLSFNGESSVVKCKPHTGRTHQIRVHIQYLGYPILNDPIYSGDVWGDSEGKNGEYGQTEAELIKKLSERHCSSLYLDSTDAGVTSLQFSPSAASVSHVMDKSADTEQQTDERVVSESDDASVRNMNDDDSDDVSLDEPETKKLKVAVDEVTETDRTCNKSDSEESVQRILFDPACRECRSKYVELTPDQLIMYLHAYSYKGPGWSYQTDLPKWASADYSS